MNQQEWKAQGFKADIERQTFALSREIGRLESHAMVLCYNRLLRTNLELLEREASKAERGHVLDYRRLYRSIHDNLDPEIENIEQQIDARKAELRLATPPPSFIEQFGWMIYMLYKEAHPEINSETKLHYQSGMFDQFFYAIPIAVKAPAVTEASSASMNIEHGVTKVEHWRGLSDIYFAWADKINTVFWRNCQPPTA